MMDFLRRLAPPRETDTTRAVPVLPSWFVRESPLRSTTAQTGPVHHPDDDDTRFSLDAKGGAAATNDLAGQRRHSTVWTDAPAEASDSEAGAPSVYPDRHEALSGRTRSASPEQHRPSVGSAARERARDRSVPPGPAHVRRPLSRTILAQRSLQRGDDGQVVHVTIGRIDVVANTGPAPAVRRGPLPRPGTATLSDYLRGDNGKRR